MALPSKGSLGFDMWLKSANPAEMLLLLLNELLPKGSKVPKNSGNDTFKREMLDLIVPRMSHLYFSVTILTVTIWLRVTRLPLCHCEPDGDSTNFSSCQLQKH